MVIKLSKSLNFLIIASIEEMKSWWKIKFASQNLEEYLVTYKVEQLVLVVEMHFVGTLGTWIWVPARPHTSWWVLVNHVSSWDLVASWLKVKDKIRKWWTVSFCSLLHSLICSQRGLFSPGEVKDKADLEALEYGKMGPGDPSQLGRFLEHLLLSSESRCSLKSQQRGTSSPFTGPYPHEVDIMIVLELMLTQFTVFLPCIMCTILAHIFEGKIRVRIIPGNQQ